MIFTLGDVGVGIQEIDPKGRLWSGRKTKRGALDIFRTVNVLSSETDPCNQLTEAHSGRISFEVEF